MRVVSLLPSTTEVVVALGYGDDLVGRSHECDFPPDVLDLPVVTRPREQPVGTSREIHRGVVDLLEQLLSLYEVDPSALRAADPDLIITQDLCRVCAVPKDAVIEAASVYLGEEVDVLTSSPATLGEVFADVRRIGEALGDLASAERLVSRMQRELHDLAASVAGLRRPRVALLEWTDPLMAAGHWAPELIQTAGAVPVLGAWASRSPTITFEELHVSNPDVILVAPCGYDLSRAVAEREVLMGIPGWDELAAVRTGRVAFADGSAYFNRPGPRLVTSAAIIAAVAHSRGPAMELEGSAWQEWPS